MDTKAVLVRMPVELYDGLKATAFFSERSMNDIAVSAIAAYLAAQSDDTLDDITARARERYRGVLDKLREL